MTSPTASIVITNYNYARFIRDAIESALAQTYSKIEVVVVDDGSTDDSRGVIDEYGNRVLRVYKPNGGMGSAHNAGFKASSGDIVVFLDSDDWLSPDAVETVVGAWQADVAQVQYPVTIADASGKSCGRTLPMALLTGEEIIALLREGFFYPRSPTSGHAFSRALLEKIMPMPEPEWRRASETYMCLHAPFAGKVIMLRKPLAFYRIHSANDLAGGSFELGKAHMNLRQTHQALRTLEPLARNSGMRLSKDWLFATPDLVADRLASLRLSPLEHPYPGDTALGLAARGIRASLKHPLISRRKRMYYLGLFGLFVALPASVVRRIMDTKYRLRYAAGDSDHFLRWLRMSRQQRGPI